MNLYHQLSITCLLLILSIVLFSIAKNINSHNTKMHSVNKSDRKEYVFKPGDKKMMILAFILFLLIGTVGKAQPFVHAGAGISNKYFSAELQAGYRYQHSTLSIGYIALPERTQPALFNVRAGYVIAERVHVYAGYVRVMYSLDDKSRNSNTWQVGAQYLFCFYDRGSFYIGGNYTGNNMISANVGMTFQLSKGFH